MIHARQVQLPLDSPTHTRDGECVITGDESSECDAAHVIPRSKGSSVSMFIWSRPASGDAHLYLSASLLLSVTALAYTNNYHLPLERMVNLC